MRFNCIITQGHIPSWDPQGGLTADTKLEMFNVSLRHLRKNNPDAYIILTGHGAREPDFSLCDWHYWEPQQRSMHDSGYLVGMPAQFLFVDIGIEHAQQVGFDKCLKTRTDCVVQRPNITRWCEDVLQSENKQILLTQQTGHDRIGDCFMYGSVSDMRTIWHRDNPIHHSCGLLNTGHHFMKAFSRQDGEPWLSYIRRYAAFRDVVQIPFICLRWNYHILVQNGDIEKIATNDLDVLRYHWGYANGWHKFDTNMNVIHNSFDFHYTQQQFYSA